ncbi:MAG TPA: glycosyltransferase family 2 protein [Candidatus Elarobacter sp.]|nr:glycosyltransferase family 2 protein [Candidatus Elarobacter sp.]
MVRFAAIIGHADEAELLERCIAHHLAIGVDRIFVSLNVDDPRSEDVARAFEATGRVRVERLEAFARDPFEHFTEAKDRVVAWCDPEWVLFVDSDEFWVPRTGSIAECAAPSDVDVLDVPMFQAPPVRASDGTIAAVALADPASLPIIGTPVMLDADALARDPDLAPFVSWSTKVLARPAFVAQVERGAHGIVSAIGPPRSARAADLAIVHVPFTTRERFRRKIARVRARLAAYGDRFAPNQAWHWRRWLAIDDAGGIDAEFDRNTIAAGRLPLLVADGIVTTAARRFAADRAPCAR